MIGYIIGKVTETSENNLIIEANGIGYERTVSSFCLSELTKTDSEAKVYTHLNVREDGVTLFGFYSKADRNMFLRLISVSGVGPKMAVGILSGISIGDLAAGVASADTKALNAVKGIGKKTAERIVLELKDKIVAEFESELPKSIAMSDIIYEDDDAVEALISLGYKKSEAVLAVSKLKKENLSTEEIILRALKG